MPGHRASRTRPTGARPGRGRSVCRCSTNPASLIRLADGRVCLTYGYRAAPYGLRARLSHDGGRTWGKEIVLRADGGGRDLGYPRSLQRRDGKIVTVYYFHDEPRGDRYIA